MTDSAAGGRVGRETSYTLTLKFRPYIGGAIELRLKESWKYEHGEAGVGISLGQDIRTCLKFIHEQLDNAAYQALLLELQLLCDEDLEPDALGDYRDPNKKVMAENEELKKRLGDTNGTL